VAGGFAEAPYAKMELRFIATEAGDVPGWGVLPARVVPTEVESTVELHPAVAVGSHGAAWRFV
jgi:hypothetical protein